MLLSFFLFHRFQPSYTNLVLWNWLEKMNCKLLNFFLLFAFARTESFSFVLRTIRSSALLFIKTRKKRHHLMCHLHPLHLLFYIIINYNKAIVLFNNFCAIHHPGGFGPRPRATRACVSGWECFHNGIVCEEPSVLEVKGTEKEIEKFCWGGSVWGFRGVKKNSLLFCLHCFPSLFEIQKLFCYTNQKNEKQIIQLNILLFPQMFNRQGATWFSGRGKSYSATFTNVPASYSPHQHHDSSSKQQKLKRTPS